QLSPTATLRFTAMPVLFNSCAIHALLVSITWPISNSSPIVMMLAKIFFIDCVNVIDQYVFPNLYVLPLRRYKSNLFHLKPYCMSPQNFSNHVRYDPIYHFGLYGAIIALLIGSAINL